MTIDARAYRYIIRREQSTDGEDLFVARDPSLPGCMAHGETAQEALENLAEARRLYLADLADTPGPAAARHIDETIIVLHEAASYSVGSIVTSMPVKMVQFAPVRESESVGTEAS